MINAMIYQGYTAHIDFDPRDSILAGRALGIGDSISFHGETLTDLTGTSMPLSSTAWKTAKRQAANPKNLTRAI